MNAPETPVSILPHQEKYREGAWNEYTMLELGMWVHLLSTRAEHRTDPTKREKDLTDAANYLDMMRAKLAALKA